MRLLSTLTAGLFVASLAAAHATPVGNGTVSTSDLFNPMVNLTSNPNTYSINAGSTFQISGTQSFAGVGGLAGTDNGTLSFSSVVGATIAQTLSNFFVFNDGAGGKYKFSVASVRTLTFSNVVNTTTAFSLYLLGTTIDNNLDETTPTPTSLTISTNSTGPSAFASSQTLAIPPAGTAVPEPVSLALFGSALVGIGLVRRRA